GNVFIYVSRPGTIGSPTAPGGGGPSMIAPRTQHAVAYYPGLGIFMAGGLGPGKKPLDSISLWFSYELQGRSNPDTFKLSGARGSLAGGYDPTQGLIEWAGGADMTGAPTSLIEIMDPTGQIGLPYVRPWTPAGQAAEERTQAAAAYGVDSLLLFGGLGHDK